MTSIWERRNDMSNKHTLYLLFIAAAVSLLFATCLTGCSAETAGVSGFPAGKIPVTILFAPEKTTANEDGKINTLDIYIVDADGKVEAHANGYEGATPISIELQPGLKTVYAFANCTGTTFGDLGLASGSWKSVPEAVSSNAAFNAIDGITADGGIPMSARTTWEVSEKTTTKAVQLVRMAAKMEITITDERENKEKNITSLKIGQLLPGSTHLFRQGSGEVGELPGSPSFSDWEWTRPADNTEAPSIAPFYLHETKGTFTVSMAVNGEAVPRTTTLTTAIPRNRIYPLTIHLSDYSLDIKGSYRLAAIGTVAVKKNIGNGYTIELPEGCSNVEISIQLKENGVVKNSGITWDYSPTTIDHFTCNASGADATLILSSAALPAIAATSTVTVTANFTDKSGQSQKRSFGLTIQVNDLTDDLTKASRPTGCVPSPKETQPIDIEL